MAGAFVFGKLFICLLVFRSFDGIECVKDKTDNPSSGSSEDDENKNKGELPAASESVENGSKNQNGSVQFLVDLDITRNCSSETYDYVYDNGVETYIPKDKCRFKGVRENRHQIWETMRDVCANKVKIRHRDLGEMLMDIFLSSGKKITFFKHGVSDPWVESDYECRVDLRETKCLKDVTIVTVSGFYPVQYENNDSSKFSIYKVQDNEYEYLFKQEVKCVEVKCVNKTVWSHEEGRDYIKSVRYNCQKGILAVNYIDDKMIYEKYKGEWILTPSFVERSVTKSRFKSAFCESNFRIITEGSARSNDTGRYDRCMKGDVLKYIFKSEGKCVEIKYGNQSVWKKEDFSDDEYPDVFHVNLSTRSILIVSKYFIYAYSYNGIEWRPEYEGGFETSEVDIKKKRSTREIDYEEGRIKGMSIYMSKEKKLINKVKEVRGRWCNRRENVIWEACNETEYSKKIVLERVESKLKVVNIHLLDGKMKRYKKDRNSNWVEIDDDMKIPVLVDIGMSVESSAHYTCNHGRMRTYIAKNGYIFRGVVRRRIFVARDLVWEAKDENEHADKVVVEGMGSVEREITVYAVDGTSKTFQR